MEPQACIKYNIFDDPLEDAEELEETSEDDLWFLPGPIEVEPDYLPPGPRAELRETAVLDDWGVIAVTATAAATREDQGRGRRGGVGPSVCRDSRRAEEVR